jgi:hypothetical protein
MDVAGGAVQKCLAVMLDFDKGWGGTRLGSLRHALKHIFVLAKKSRLCIVEWRLSASYCVARGPMPSYAYHIEPSSARIDLG